MIGFLVAVVAYSKDQTHLFLVWLAWIFAATTAGALYSWLWQYQEVTGWFFRCKVWALWLDLDPFVRGALRREDAAFLSRAEFSEIRTHYFQLFNKRLRSVLTEGQRRGCISPDPDSFNRYLDPSNVEQMGANSESLRTLALRYRADQY